jgi:hypothetical protein
MGGRSLMVLLRSAGVQGASHTWPRLAAARRVDPAHALLIAVSAGYCLLVLLRTPQSMTLTFDEVVYASQLSASVPPAEWHAHRAWGMPLLLAPVVQLTDSVVALRGYLSIGSGLLMYLAYLPWLGVFRQERLRYLPAVAAGLFGTLWMTVLWGSLAYPNLWLGFALVAGVGWFVRVVREPPAWIAVVGVAIAFAVASLIRPTDALFAAAPLLIAPVLARGWRRPWPPLAVAAGLLIGWAAWIGEAFARFGGPAQRLHDSAAATGTFTRSGPLIGLSANLDAVDGPSLLCRPASDCAGVDPPAAAVWWLLLPVLVGAAMVVADRTGWFGEWALATAAAVSFAAPYLLLLDYASPRFLLPAYALLAIPVAGVLTSVTGLGPRTVRLSTTVAVVAAVLAQAAVQQGVLETNRGRMERTYGRYERLADAIREEGVRPPCLIWGTGAIPLSYPLKCGASRGSGVPSPADPAIAAALTRGDMVLVRIRADTDPPLFLTSWRRVADPVNPDYVLYTPVQAR